MQVCWFLNVVEVGSRFMIAGGGELEKYMDDEMEPVDGIMGVPFELFVCWWLITSAWFICVSGRSGNGVRTVEKLGC